MKDKIYQLSSTIYSECFVFQTTEIRNNEAELTVTATYFKGQTN